MSPLTVLKRITLRHDVAHVSSIVREQMSHYPILIFAASLLFSCSSLNDEEEASLNQYKLNSKNFFTQKSYMKVIDQCSKGLALDEDDYSLNLELGMAYLYHAKTLNKRDKKLEYLYAALEQLERTDSLRWFNDDFRVHLCLGMLHYTLATEYRKQIAEFEKRIDADPSLADDFEKKIEECRDGLEDETDKAKEHLAEVLATERQEDNLDALLYMGEVHAYRFEHEESIEYLVPGIEALDRSTAYLQRRLESKESMGNYERVQFEQLLDRNIRWEKNFRSVLADAFARLDRHEERLEQYAILEERDLMETHFYYNKALAEEAMGRLPDALLSYHMFIRKSLGSDSSIEQKKRLDMASGNMMKILEKIKETDDLEAFCNADPAKERELRISLASVYFTFRMFDECLLQYDTLEAKGMMEGDLFFRRGHALQGLGRWREAILDYERFLKEGRIFQGTPLFEEATDNIRKCREALAEDNAI